MVSEVLLIQPNNRMPYLLRHYFFLFLFFPALVWSDVIYEKLGFTDAQGRELVSLRIEGKISISDDREFYNALKDINQHDYRVQFDSVVLNSPGGNLKKPLNILANTYPFCCLFSCLFNLFLCLPGRFLGFALGTKWVNFCLAIFYIIFDPFLIGFIELQISNSTIDMLFSIMTTVCASIKF